jgi:hypothetical protein
MPVQIAIDADAVLARVDNMYADIKTMKLETLPQEFENWQTEDMHRKYPEMTFHPGEEEAIVMTRIWPRSRDDVVGGRRKRLFTIPKNISRAQLRRYRLASITHKGRPILRPELYEKLCERMAAMLQTLKWRKAS